MVRWPAPASWPFRPRPICSGPSVPAPYVLTRPSPYVTDTSKRSLRSGKFRSVAGLGTGLQSFRWPLVRAAGSVVMTRTIRRGGIMFAGALLAGLLPAAPALAAPASCGGSGTMTTLSGTLPDGAAYEIQCPAGPWNGTLFLYSHGYVVPGSRQPGPGRRRPGHGRLAARPRVRPGRFLLRDHRLGDPAGAARPDRHAGRLRSGFGTPAPDRSPGATRSAASSRPGLIQRYPGRFTAALPMCGVLSGGVATWNTALDAEFAFQQLIDPVGAGRQHHRPLREPDGAERPRPPRSRRPQGRARLALAAALGDTPGWFTPLSPEPRRERLRGPGGQPVPVGHPGRLPVRLRASAPSSRRGRAGTRPGTRA